MTKFGSSFMMKSPLYEHGEKLRQEAMKLSKESSGRDDAPDYDNPKVVELLDKAKKADKSHGSDSPAKMSPFQGYVDGEERVSHYQPTADLYKDMIGTITSSVDKIAASGIGSKKKAKKKQNSEIDQAAKKITSAPDNKTMNIDTDFADLYDESDAEFNSLT